MCLPVIASQAAILIIHDVSDIEPDRRSHKRTLIVRWGARGARLIFWGLRVIALPALGERIVRHALPIWYAPVAVAIGGLGL